MYQNNIIYELSQEYTNPLAVQNYIKSLKYNRRDTLSSAITSIQRGSAHCIEASFVAAAILECHGYDPLVLDLESQDGLDHVVFVFKENNRWGSISRSRDVGLEGREPIFRTLRDLAWSYFDPYIDESGKLTSYQCIHLDETQSNWRYSSKNVWKAERYLIEIPHVELPSASSRYEKIKKEFLRTRKIQPKDHWW